MIELVNRHSRDVADLCRQFSVKCLELFGSALSDDDFDPQTSDIDFLVEFMPLEPRQHGKSYFALLEKLQGLFGCNIDLVEVKAITNPYLMESVNRNRIKIYAA
jgi:predicted nucleotidyltransferase